MTLLQVHEQSRKYFSDDFIEGFNLGAKAQYSRDKEEKTGKWLIPQRRGAMSWNEKAYAECSVCHEVVFNARSMKFCPQC